MACVLPIAYYYAYGDYIFHREYQTGWEFADLVMIPCKDTTTPTIIVELKYDDTTVGKTFSQKFFSRCRCEIDRRWL